MFNSRVVGQPSLKTSFVILGNGVGPNKLKAIEDHNLRTLDEDGFMNLIATRKGPSAGGEVDNKTRKEVEKKEEIKQSKGERLGINIFGLLVGVLFFISLYLALW